MRIEIDAVVREYVFRVLASILYGPHASVQMINENDDRAQEEAVMFVLEQMVASGAADHKYDNARKIDEFNSTERLVRNWGWAFPGDKLSIDRSERHVLAIKGKRSRFFNSKWLAQDEDNPHPSWPN